MRTSLILWDSFLGICLFEQLCCFEHLIFILFFHIFRCFNLDLAVEAKDPVEEHCSDGHLSNNTEVLLITGIGLNIWSESIDNCIHHTVVTDQFHFPTGSIVHTESGIYVFIDIETKRSRNSSLIEDLWSLINAIHTMAANRLIFIRVPDNIIEVPVPNQRVGTEGICLTAVMKDTVLLDVVLNLLKPDLATLIDSVVYCPFSLILDLTYSL